MLDGAAMEKTVQSLAGDRVASRVLEEKRLKKWLHKPGLMEWTDSTWIPSPNLIRTEHEIWNGL